ncbi:MAG TPA: ABC-F family ATP-binding cassette domain-containing protein [Saprospiraceae bacterium]|nr:ABC-F family ATP-binding cassette domain-containing protein [Saprospiraceae bacterium]
MNFLTLENISKSYGDKLLFSYLSLFINEGQKIGLIARNGAGKTTLLRVIAGLEGSEGENATIQFKKNLRIGYLTQEPDLNPENTVLNEVFSGDHPKLSAVKEYEAALVLHNEDKLQDAMHSMDDLHAWDMEARVKEILSKLSIDDFQQKVKELSGGQQKRLALAKVLINEPEFLILDEPTNHLDVAMIEWLENYLSQPNITLLLVTHDRYFLENVCNEIIELDRGKLYKYSGSYSDYLEKKASRTVNDQVTLEKDKKLYLKELDWARRMPQARTTKSKSRLDSFEALKSQLAGKREEGSLQINLKPNRLGSKIVEAHNISKRYDDKVLFKNFSYKFKRLDRIGIIGPNGAGKSSLLYILTGLSMPDSGKVVIGDTVIFGYYTQTGMKLQEDKRVIDVVSAVSDNIPVDKGLSLSAAQLLERFMFPREQQQVYVSQLSGGERRRLYLLTILMANPNFLILDEPTNDLDLVTLNVLEEYLETFQGCLLMVSHDRYFMDKLVDHVFVFEGDGHLSDFPGTYSQYREKKSLEQFSDDVKADVSKNQGKASYEEQKELQRVEKDIAKLQKEKAALTAGFSSEISVEEAQLSSRRLKEIDAKIEEKEMIWLRLAEKYE